MWNFHEDTKILFWASDETSPTFFDAFTSKGHDIYFWKDFFGDEAKSSLKIDEEVPRKLIGCIEQVICAGARIFFGTRRSTFTAYITRLRGYVKAPDTNAYLHNNVHVSNISFCVITRSGACVCVCVGFLAVDFEKRCFLMNSVSFHWDRRSWERWETCRR